MRKVFSLFLLALSVAAAGLFAACSGEKETSVPGLWQGDAAAAQTPAPDQNALGRPLIRAFGATSLRGTAFILDWRGRPYMVSCYHVFGSYPGDAALMRQETQLGEASGALNLGGGTATFHDNCDAHGEITVMPVKSLSVASKHFKLALAAPKAGQPVWLYHMSWEDELSRKMSGASQYGIGSFQTFLTKGRVARSSDRALEVEYDGQPAIEMTSGAPVLDQNGDVVGINVGLCLRGNDSRGLAAPYQTLADAFAKQPD
jgi:hypothetical protein